MLLARRHGKDQIWSAFKSLNEPTATMDDRILDLTEAQQATKSKYPPINKKYECKSEATKNKIASLACLTLLLFVKIVSDPDVS